MLRLPNKFFRLKLVLAVVLTIFIAAGCGGGGGEAVTNITGTTFDGDPYDLHAGVGRPLVLNFWYPSCPPCVVELPDFQRAYEEFGDEVDFLAVFSPLIDTEATARQFIAELGVTFPVLTDAAGFQFQTEYGITSFPTTFFINADRTSARRYVGGPIPPAELEANITNLIN